MVQNILFINCDSSIIEYSFYAALHSSAFLTMHGIGHNIVRHKTRDSIWNCWLWQIMYTISISVQVQHGQSMYGSRYFSHMRLHFLIVNIVISDYNQCEECVDWFGDRCIELPCVEKILIADEPPHLNLLTSSPPGHRLLQSRDDPSRSTVSPQ